MSTRQIWRSVTVALLAGVTLLAVSAALCPESAVAQQEELNRKVKVKVSPVYPDIARRMNIIGSVKISVVVSPNGTVKSTKLVGGHPLLVSSALDALKKWKFEPASEESTGIVEFKFQPQDQ